MPVFALNNQLEKLHATARSGVGDAPYTALGPVEQAGQRPSVGAVEDDEVFGPLLQDLLELDQVSGGVLDHLHVGNLHQVSQDLGGEVHLGVGGDVVDHDGQGHGVVDGLVVVDQLLGGSHLVEWRHDHQGVAAYGLGVLAQLYRFPGAASACVSHHRHPSGHLIDRHLGDPFPLLEAQACELTGAAARNNAVHAALQLELD